MKKNVNQNALEIKRVQKIAKKESWHMYNSNFR